MSEEVKDVLTELGKTFEEFKSENKKRLDEIESKGQADPLLQEKVDKMSEDMSATRIPPSDFTLGNTLYWVP